MEGPWVDMELPMVVALEVSEDSQVHLDQLHLEEPLEVMELPLLSALPMEDTLDPLMPQPITSLDMEFSQLTTTAQLSLVTTKNALLMEPTATITSTLPEASKQFHTMFQNTVVPLDQLMELLPFQLMVKHC
jgi:hypothetical protein